MEFKTYNPEEDDYLRDGFHDFLRRPEDVEKYRKTIREALEDAEEVVGMDSDVEILFGLTDTGSVHERWGEEAAPEFYVYGFTFGSHFEGKDRNFIFLRANDFPSNWKAVLKNMAVHERAHIEFFRSNSDEELDERLSGAVYNSVLFEGHSTNTAARLNEEKGYGWNPDFRKKGNEVDFEELKAELEKDRTESSFFDHGGDEWTEAEGYPISFEIFNWVIENKGLEVKDLPSLSEDEARELIDEAAEELYR
ncbi:MAG: hypothetical protein ABEK04_05230 [Candidatus Nanohalobium sp.]